MKFEDKLPEIKTVTFEVNESINFTEHRVAINALGLLTLKYANDDSKRLPPAKLGVELAALAQKSHEDDKKKDEYQSAVSPKPLVRELSKSQAQLLYEALDELIESAPTTIVSLSVSQSPRASSGRAVEVDMARNMQEQLQEAFELPVKNLATPPVGFH